MYILINNKGEYFTFSIGEEMTNKGIGNGVSMLIFAGIIASVPTQFVNAYYSFVNLTGTSSEMFSGFIKLLIYVFSLNIISLILISS